MNSQAAIADATPGLGHNATSKEAMLRADLEERFRYMLDRNKELIAKLPTIPETVDENSEKIVSDYLKSVKVQLSSIENARKAENEEHLAAQRMVNGLFKAMMAEPLVKVRDAVAERHQAWLDKKAEAEKKAAEEKARLAREAAEKARAEAEEKRRREQEEADRLRAEAAEKQRLHDEEMARQRAAIAAAEAKRREEAERLERDRQEAEQRRIAAEQAEEASKRARAKAIREAEEAEARAEAAKREAERAAAEEKKRLEREADALRRQQEAERERAERAAAAAARSAGRADRELERAEKKEDAAIAKEEAVDRSNSADFGRVRGHYGSLSTLRERMTFANLDRATLDLESLRQHIPRAGLEQAVRSFIKAGGTELAGVDIFEDTSLMVR